MSLITLAEFKTHISAPDSARDALYSQMIPLVEDEIARECNRIFEEPVDNALSLYCDSVAQNALSIYCDAGGASAATVQVTATAMVLIITGGTSAGTNTLTFSQAANDTLTELVVAINALDGWTATLIGTGAWASTDLAILAATSCLGIGNTRTLLTEAVTAATVQVTATAMILTITGGVDAATTTLAFADANKDTLTEIVAAINAVGAAFRRMEERGLFA